MRSTISTSLSPVSFRFWWIALVLSVLVFLSTPSWSPALRLIIFVSCRFVLTFVSCSLVSYPNSVDSNPNLSRFVHKPLIDPTFIFYTRVCLIFFLQLSTWKTYFISLGMKRPSWVRNNLTDWSTCFCSCRCYFFFTDDYFFRSIV